MKHLSLPPLFTSKQRLVHLTLILWALATFMPMLPFTAASTLTPSTATLNNLLYAKEATIKAFYKALTTDTTRSTEQLKNDIEAILAEDWDTTPDPRAFAAENSERANIIVAIQYFHQVIPDLTWTPIKILRSKNNYTVIATAAGTPQDVFFGIPPTGKNFEILTIDVHTIVNGKIKTSYHVEDWVNAISQLTQEE